MRDSMDGVASDQGRFLGRMTRSGSGGDGASVPTRQAELQAERPPGFARGESVVPGMADVAREEYARGLSRASHWRWRRG